jgi:hypothetical protein
MIGGCFLGCCFVLAPPRFGVEGSGVYKATSVSRTLPFVRPRVGVGVNVSVNKDFAKLKSLHALSQYLLNPFKPTWPSVGGRAYEPAGHLRGIYGSG